MDEFFPDMDMEGAQQAMQRSWNIHMQAFGPILSEAFKGNIEARAALTAALNHISRQNVKRGLELLRALKDHCRCSADLPPPVIKSDGGRLNLLFSDSYAVGLHYGYASLLELCPRELEGDWRFEIVHQA